MFNGMTICLRHNLILKYGFKGVSVCKWNFGGNHGNKWWRLGQCRNLNKTSTVK